MLTVITGPPAAGKTTYMHEHAQPGDITIDYDALAVALGSPHSHNHPHAIANVARDVRHTALTSALTTGANIWLIHADPTRKQLGWYHSLGARIVTLNPGEHVIAERLQNRRATATHRPTAAQTTASNALNW